MCGGTDIPINYDCIKCLLTERNRSYDLKRVLHSVRLKCRNEGYSMQWTTFSLTQTDIVIAFTSLYPFLYEALILLLLQCPWCPYYVLCASVFPMRHVTDAYACPDATKSLMCLCALSGLHFVGIRCKMLWAHKCSFKGWW